MALRNGIDTVAILSLGIYSETYVSATGQDRINNLYVSLGLLEIAPDVEIPTPLDVVRIPHIPTEPTEPSAVRPMINY